MSSVTIRVLRTIRDQKNLRSSLSIRVISELLQTVANFVKIYEIIKFISFFLRCLVH